MHLNILAFAVPFFVGVMLLEYYYATKQNKQLFHFDEAVANLNVGIAERLCDLFTTGLFYHFFTWLYTHYSLFHIPDHPLMWLFLFLFTDLIWYWYHRLGHEVNLLWAAHVVHHQSEDFNYTVSVRITVFQSFFRCLFWSVLPLAGFHPAAVSVMLLIHGMYPFFTHTQVIGRLGVLEYILVTPSHHRVHHSSNPEYIDKNFGDVLIIWDKLFGTFAREESEPRYGLNKPLGSFSFLWQHFHFFLELVIALKRCKGGWKEQIRILFGKPDRIDPGIRHWLERKLLKTNRQPAPGPALQRYIKTQTIGTLCILFGVLLLDHYLTGLPMALMCLFLLISVINTGAMLEQKKWIFELDFARLGIAGLLVYCYFPYPAVAWCNILLLVIVLTGYNTLSGYYYRYFFSSVS